MLVFYLSIFIISYMATWLLRRLAITKSILDIPNHRSLHNLPIPRGGGLAFVILFGLLTPLLFYFNVINFSYHILALWSMSLFVALIGFLDDLNSLSPLVRLVGHCIAATIFLYGINGMPVIDLNIFVLSNGIILNTIGILYIVWMINLYNFMDGIDGIAAIEAISVCFGAICIYLICNQSHLIIIPGLILFLVMGFLCWNFPRARIFMGDAGSGFIGFLLAAISLQAAIHQPALFWSWLILLGVFIVDASYTLLNRIWRQEDIFSAHCSHGYQKATKLLQKHYIVSTCVLCINLLWLLPIAILVAKVYLPGPLGILIAYLPLLLIVLYFKKK